MTNTILQLGALQAIILGFFLLNRKVNQKANRVLAILVFLLGGLCLLQSLKDIDIYLQYPHLVRLDWGGGLLIGPLIYFYVRFMTGQMTQLKRNDLTVFFPYLVHLAIVLPYLLSDGELKIQTLDYYTATLSAGTDSYNLYYRLLVVFTAIVGLSYCKESLKSIKVYQADIRSEFSVLTKRELDWLKWFVWAFVLLFAILVGVYALYTRDRYASFDYEVYFYLVAFVLIYAITYNAISQPQITLPVKAPKKKKDDQPSQKVSHEPIANDLAQLMKSDRPYLNSELTATELAEKLSISRHQLSEVLNDHLQVSFYEFVNRHRVEEFKQRVEDGAAKQLTLLAIAFEVGFNSKTAFNTAFKKVTGSTPSQYLKNQGQN